MRDRSSSRSRSTLDLLYPSGPRITPIPERNSPERNVGRPPSNGGGTPDRNLGRPGADRGSNGNLPERQSPDRRQIRSTPVESSDSPLPNDRVDPLPDGGAPGRDNRFDRDDPYRDPYHRYDNGRRYRNQVHHYRPLSFYYPWYVCGQWGPYYWGSIFCHDYIYPWVWYYRCRSNRVIYLYDPYYVDQTYVSYQQIDESTAYPPLPSDHYLDPVLTIEELILRGQELFISKNYLSAAEAFRQAMMKDLNDPAPKFAYAQALFALGHYPYASLAIRNGMELAPDWPLIGGDPRDLYADESEFASHMQALEHYLENRPNDPSGLLLKGTMNYFTQNFEVARSTFEQLLDVDEQDEVGLSFLEASLAIEAGDYAPVRDDR